MLAPQGAFEAIAIGPYHGCGIRPDDTVACWAEDGSIELPAPEGAFSAVAAAGSFSCALRTDGTLTCWDAFGDGQASVKPRSPGLREARFSGQRVFADDACSW
ncbi:MAG: hypothetical protein JW940_32405 [Polyangiaceae bacterium]|nr:hypothetical protein [Polyangiaceae bacterium]